MVQLATAARLVPQVLVCAKSPVAVMELMVADALPVLLTVTACAALVVPTFWLANVRVDGVSDRFATGVVLPYTSSSPTWPAGQPELAVMFSRTKRAEVEA